MKISNKFNYRLNLFLFGVNAMLFALGNTSGITILCMVLHLVLAFYFAGKVEDESNDETDA